MISFDEAIAIITETAKPLGSEEVALADAAARVLSAPLSAAIDSPRADVSAMDGYAVRNADLADFPRSLEVIGESFPGAPFEGELGPGRCVRIFTGAPLPLNADRIVIQEEIRRKADHAIIEIAPSQQFWIRRRGSDFAARQEVLAAGTLLSPAALIAAGGADSARLTVYCRPRVAVLSTGDELIAPGEARNARFTVPDSISVGVAALAETWGAEVVGRELLPDDRELMANAARRIVNEADLVVVTGGASVGERDFAKAMFEPLGLSLKFGRISMRPGKPAWFGTVGQTLVLGLPGNPTSALVTARLLLCPLLTAMTGRNADEALRWERAPLSTPLRGCDSRETFHRARLAGGSASLLSFKESHAQKALAEADILVRQAANSAAVPAGEPVPILRL